MPKNKAGQEVIPGFGIPNRKGEIITGVPKKDPETAGGGGKKEDPDFWLNRAGAEAKEQYGLGMDQANALFGDLDTFRGQAEAANAQTRADLGTYLGQMDTEYGNVGKAGWQDYKSLGAGYDAQLDALNKYKALTDPSITAEERFMMEQARQQEEQGLRSNRDAVMQDLAARGMRGSGAELTNMLGAQQQLGNQRVLADLGAQANASKRAMQALEGYGTTAGQMRSAEDVVGTFNAQQGQAAREWQAQEQQKIRENQNTARTTAGTTTYGRDQDVLNATANTRGFYNDTLNNLGGRVVDFKMKKAGVKEDRAAADMLANQEQTGFSLGNIFRPDRWFK